jgi:hypothetical protein
MLARGELLLRHLLLWHFILSKFLFFCFAFIFNIQTVHSSISFVLRLYLLLCIFLSAIKYSSCRNVPLCVHNISDSYSNISMNYIIMKEEFEDSKGIIRIRKWKKDRQHNGQKIKNKSTNSDLQNIIHKTKNQVTRTPIKPGGELMSSERCRDGLIAQLLF